ncbi:MAG: endonuclease III domain-containing protein [Candidatus Micrarchaeota archaeon]|nr:endonuclease III domain-containing protein [Candidatus Micrarchaeota archaeon]
MTRLGNKLKFDILPTPPFSFKLTVKKPTGWFLFNPFEVYKDGTLWTSTYLDGIFAGIKLTSSGTVDHPKVSALIFTNRSLSRSQEENVKRLLAKAIGAEHDLNEFYRIARKDAILKHVIGDLYGMHDTFSTTIFSDALLAILLQMAPLKRSNEMMESLIQNYGDTAEFDGKKIKAWPTPKRLAAVSPEELARRCKVGYRAKSIVKLANRLAKGDFPTAEQLEDMDADSAKELLLELPGIGDYSADIINPHGGFPIDVWSAEVFGKLFFGKEPKNNRKAVEKVKKEGLRRWGKWSWMAFFYVVQDLDNLSRKLGKSIRLA